MTLSALLPGTVVDMPSGVFESAGLECTHLSGGPWHKGDDVAANLLLRNVGVEEGRVRLVDRWPIHQPWELGGVGRWVPK